VSTMARQLGAYAEVAFACHKLSAAGLEARDGEGGNRLSAGQRPRRARAPGATRSSAGARNADGGPATGRWVNLPGIADRASRLLLLRLPFAPRCPIDGRHRRPTSTEPARWPTYRSRKKRSAAPAPGPAAHPAVPRSTGPGGRRGGGWRRWRRVIDGGDVITRRSCGSRARPWPPCPRRGGDRAGRRASDGCRTQGRDREMDRLAAPPRGAMPSR
jgi:hypothetical protein